jgi:flagellar hook-associated protein 2
VSAAAVRVADGSYRLKITADGTGAAKAFTLGGSLAPADPANAIITTGTDAEISLGAGATVRSATNTFTGLLLGVDVTVAAKTAADAPPVTVTIAKDTSAATTKVAALVSSLGVVLSDIADRTKAATDGTSGVLVGDSGMRLLRAALSDAVSGLAGGAPLSQIGVELKRDGTVVFDQGKLAAMLASDPAKAKAMVTDLATRLADVAKGASDPTTGTITQAITSQKDTVKDLNDRITTWDTRLAVRKSALERQFASLETALQGMNSQSSWLGSAIAGLPGFR